MLVKRKILTGGFFVLLAAVLFLPLADSDFGWHYRCGRLLWQGGSCAVNNFSYLLAGYRWAYPSLLYDGLVAPVFDGFGFLGLSLVGSLVLTAGFFAVWRTMKAKEAIKILMIGGMIFLSWGIVSSGFKAQWLSWVFWLWGLRLVLEDKGEWLVGLILVWVNTHGSFFLGLLLLLFWLIDRLIRKKKIIRTVAVGAAGWLVTLVNPFGFRVYGEVYRHFRVPLNTLIAEWVAPVWWQSGLVIALLFLGLRKNLFRVLLLVFLSWLALKARRNLPLFFLSYPMILGEALVGIGKKWNWREINEVMLLLVLPLMFLFFGFRAVKTVGFDTNWRTYCDRGYVRYPCGAAEYLKGKKGNLYNAYEWGGFLIWQLPQMRVFVDGRMPAWDGGDGKSPYTSYLEVIQARDGWNEYLRRFGTDYLLIAPGTFLDLELDNGEAKKWGWREEYRDAGAVVYGLMR